MKIGFASDLHIEFKDQKPIPVSEPLDVLILAGDIHTQGRGLLWGWETYKDHARHIIIIFGNHDYWGKTYQKVIADARDVAAAIPNLHFLENNSICIDGVWFIGATLWTDYLLGPNPRDLNMWLAREGMNDFGRIKFIANGSYRRFLPQDAALINERSKKFIFEQIRNIRSTEPDALIVVATHHGPTFKSLDPLYAGSKLNPCYVNVLEKELENDEGPDVWIHGHVHNENVYKVGKTWVLCNPIGYPGQIRDTKIKYLEYNPEESESEQ